MKLLFIFLSDSLLVSLPLKTHFAVNYPIQKPVIELNSPLLKNDQKGCFPFIDHPFEIKCRSSKHTETVTKVREYIFNKT